jgi:hypothetical protein
VEGGTVRSTDQIMVDSRGMVARRGATEGERYATPPRPELPMAKSGVEGGVFEAASVGRPLRAAGDTKYNNVSCGSSSSSASQQPASSQL